MASSATIAHRVHYPDLAGLVPGAGDAAGAGIGLVIGGDEAHHAGRVKRLRPGERVEVFDGRGAFAEATIGGITTGKRAALSLTVGEVRRAQPGAPRVEVWCPPPKGDRLDTMLDQLSQIGVASWRPLRAGRSERNDFRADKLRRVAIESAKQSGRAWLIDVGDWIGFEDAIADPRAILADASGGTVSPEAHGDTVLLLGPEGGWTAGELGRFRATGRPIARFGRHVMRIETAAVVGAGCLLTDTNGGEA